MNGRPNRQAAAAEDKHTFVASDYYGDCTKSLLEVTIVLLTQSALLVFYVLGLYTGETPDFSNGRVFAFYYAGCAVQAVIIFNHKLPDHFATIGRFWRFTALWLRYNNDAECRGQKGTKTRNMSQVSRYLRLFGSSAINLLGLAIVTTTIPVFLCTSETYIDFVLNAAATLFIVELDDLTDSTTIVLQPPEDQEMIITMIGRGDDYHGYHDEDEDATADFLSS